MLRRFSLVPALLDELKTLESQIVALRGRVQDTPGDRNPEARATWGHQPCEATKAMMLGCERDRLQEEAKSASEELRRAGAAAKR